MDVIGFLCVSLGSSTVQLHDSLGSRRECACSETGFSRQNGDRVWEMYYQRATFSCVFFYGQKDSMQRIWKCSLRKAVHNLVEKFSQGRSKITNDEMEVRKWLRQQSKDFCAEGFDALIRDEICVSMLVGDISRNLFFDVLISYCEVFYLHLWPVCWLSLVFLYNRTKINGWSLVNTMINSPAPSEIQISLLCNLNITCTENAKHHETNLQYVLMYFQFSPSFYLNYFTNIF
jgi:hypothetical protein